jgi:hypothetical protein
MSNSKNKHPENRRTHQMSIPGGVLISRSPDFKQEHDAERKQDGEKEKNNFWLAVATLGSLFVVAGLTFWQGWLTRKIVRISQKTYEVSERPYIGVEQFDAIFIYVDKNGEPQASQNPRPDAIAYKWSARIKNFGPVPGTNFTTSMRVFWNGQETILVDRLTNTATTFFPSEETSVKGMVPQKLVQSLMSQTRHLETEITIDYDTPTGHDHSCIKHFSVVLRDYALLLRPRHGAMGATGCSADPESRRTHRNAVKHGDRPMNTPFSPMTAPFVE